MLIGASGPRCDRVDGAAAPAGHYSTPVSPLVSAPRSRLAEGARFAVVGLSSTAVTVAVFNLLTHIGDEPALRDHPIEAYTIAMFVGTFVSFVGNRWWVFDAGGSTGWAREAAVFVAINAVGTLIPSACLAVSRYGLHLRSVTADNVSANVVGLLLATLFRYWAYRNIAFGAARTQPRAGTGAP